jgi:hypothetical protein
MDSVKKTVETTRFFGDAKVLFVVPTQAAKSLSPVNIF